MQSAFRTGGNNSAITYSDKPKRNCWLTYSHPSLLVVVVDTLEDALNPDRTIRIYYSWNNMNPAIGVDVTFIAVMIGYDNLEYSIQWQHSSNYTDWTDVSGANELRYSETITRDNYKDYWRVQVRITDTGA